MKLSAFDAQTGSGWSQPFNPPIQMPSHDTPGDAGAGGAGGTDAGAGGGGGGTNTPAPYKLSDDSIVDLGDGKSVKWSDARTSRYMDRSSYDRGVEFLNNMAKQLDARTPQKVQQSASRPNQQQQQPVDPFAGLEDQPVISGKDVVKLARTLQQSNAPMAQFMAQLGQRLEKLEQGYTAQSKTVSGLAERHSNVEFDSYVTNTLKGIPEIKGLGTLPSDNPVLQDLVKDIYLSHEQSDPNLAREVPKLVAARVQALFDVFKKLQSTVVEESAKKKRAFFNPAQGIARQTGDQKYQHLTGTQLAEHLFGDAAAG